MEQKRTIANRLICYFIGLFIMTAGIAISVKSDLGVSPVSSIPYTLTRCWGIEMGKATILFHCILVLLQILIRRKNFKLKSLLQIPVGIVFHNFLQLSDDICANTGSYCYSYLYDSNQHCACCNRNLFLSACQYYAACRRRFDASGF